MSKKRALLFPGQGAQYVGMGKDFYDSFLVAKETFQEADEFLSQNFSKLIFEGPLEELIRTKNSQPAIYIVSVAMLRVFQAQLPQFDTSVCAGLSLGEYTALFASGRVSFIDGLSLVRQRGLYMDEACLEAPGTMRVVLGLDENQIAPLLPQNVWIANLNCPGQVVIAGLESAMSAAEESLKSHGAKRVLPLEVSGAFHTPLMNSAKKRLEPALQSFSLFEGTTDFVMNVPGDYVRSVEEIRKNLQAQVVSPTRWERGVRAMMQEGVEVYCEIGPGKSLSGMNRKIGVTGTILNIEKVAHLEECHNVVI